MRATRRFTRSLTFICVFVVGVSWLALREAGGEENASPEDAGDGRDVMQAKLSVTRNLLEAVATEDYAAMQKQAKELAALTRDAAWLVDRSPEYRRESVEFERSSFMLAEAAKGEHLAGTTLGFLNVTLSCIRCHKYLRDSGSEPARELRVPTVKADREKKGAQFWMAMKLELSKNILAGLAVGDAESVRKNAETMDRLSRIEGWARRKDARQYRRLLLQFREANAELTAHARNEQFDSAALSYTQVVLNCVKCHQHMRQTSEQESR